MPYLEINHKQLHYQDVGQGEVLLFGHSYLWDHQMWQHQVAHFSQRYRCIVPDLWGHGASDPCDEPVALSQLADEYGQLMQALQIPRFSVIGLSVGGMWGTELALKNPDAVNKLVLMDTFVGAEPDASRSQYFEMLNIVEQAGQIPLPLLQQLLPLFLSPETLNQQPSLVEHFQQQLTDKTPQQIQSIVMLGRAIFGRPSLLERLSELKMPTIFMVGEQDLPRPVPETQLMASYFNSPTVEIIPQAGHISALEQPAAVNQVLDRFF